MIVKPGLQLPVRLLRFGKIAAELRVADCTGPQGDRATDLLDLQRIWIRFSKLHDVVSQAAFFFSNASR
jgi:hypothetical protein